MAYLKIKWDEFMFNRTKLEAVWDISCFLAAVAAFTLMFFAPVTSFLQWLLVVFLAIINVSFLSMVEFFLPDISVDAYDERKHWGWCILVAVILWMFPVSVFWSLIPIGVGVLIETSLESYKLKIGPAVLSVLALSILFGYMQLNIDAKRYVMSDPKPEVVVVSNYDPYSSTFYVRGVDFAFEFDNLRVLEASRDLDIKKGDTIKIVRHPDLPKRVIKVTR